MSEVPLYSAHGLPLTFNTRHAVLYTPITRLFPGVKPSLLPPTSHQGGMKSPCPGPGFVLALAGIRRLVVQINAIEKDDLIPR